MAVHQDNMQNVAAPGDLPEEGWYHVRISKAEEVTNKKGNPQVNLELTVQDEGPMMGRKLFDYPSLLPNALFKLKAYYKAVGYNPGPEGHDPERLLDGECWIAVEHGMYEGASVANIPPWSIRSVNEGKGKKVFAKKTA